MEHKRPLGLTVDRATLEKVISTAHDFDVGKSPNNCFDGNWGGTQIWCRPHDKPTCWDAPLTGGAFGKADLVGDLHAEPRDEMGDRWELFLVLYARELSDYRRKAMVASGEYKKALREGRWGDMKGNLFLSEEDKESLYAWLRGKTLELIRLADLAPTVIGTKCPFCEFVLPNGQLLNTMVEHVVEKHPEHPLLAVCLSDPCTITCADGTYPLERAESFAS